MKSIQVIKKSLSEVDRFKRFKQAGLLAVCGVVLIPVGVVFFAEARLSYQLLIILSGFGSIILSFVFLILGALTASKKQAAFLNILYQDIWNPLIREISYPFSSQYALLTESKHEHRRITHPIIPDYSGQTVHYAIEKNQSLVLEALEYGHSVTTGERATRHVSFIGYVITTDKAADARLLIRRHAPITQFLKSGFNSFKADTVEEGYAISGDFTEELKTLKQQILHLGFDEVIMISQNQKLVILIPQFNIHSTLKLNDRLIIDAKAHLSRLIQLLELL